MSRINNAFKALRGQPTAPAEKKGGIFANTISLADWFGIGKGKKNRMVNGSSDVDIEKEHLYRGYGYGIINATTNSGVNAAEDNIRTTCSTLQREILARRDDQIVHPYIKLWQNSPYFSEYDFWTKYFTYIQLKGEFFIYMNRKKLVGADKYRRGTRNLCSPTAYMKILNPYEMSAKSYDDEGHVTEWTRTIKNPQAVGKVITQTYKDYEIIHVQKFNPWKDNTPYSLLDATKENLYTLENAKDFTRHALVNNQNAPGLLSVNGEFATQEEFDNYVASLKNHEEGEVIVAAGNAETKYQEMTQNLDGASQEKIRSIERDEMLVTTGASKSILGIETSGLTRDVAATQKLTFTERTVVPYIKLLIEALNFDYRTMYAGDFLIDKYILRVTIPSVGDKAQELKELEIREEEYNMVQRYVDRGYTRKSAAQYVRGEIDVEQLQLENGEKSRLSPKESVELVDAATRWEELITAGNDPDSVIDLINGKITMAEFLEINKDVKVSPSGGEGEGEPESTGDNPENPTPGDYYDPDRGDYSTPRDEKETPADKKKKEKEQESAEKVKKALEILSKESVKIELDQISEILSRNSLKLTKKLTKEVENKVNSVYSEEKDRILSSIFPENKDFNNLDKKERLKAQKKLDQIDYGKLNSELIK